MKVFYIVANNGDGSSSVEFYDSKECIDFLTDEETTPDMETYLDGDGGSWGSFECEGFQGRLQSLADIKSETVE